MRLECQTDDRNFTKQVSLIFKNFISTVVQAVICFPPAAGVPSLQPLPHVGFVVDETEFG